MSVLGRLLGATEEWFQDALCTQIGDGDLWFPIKGNSVRPAKKICAACPVRAECLNYALQHHDSGIWGGFTAQERDRLQRRNHPFMTGPTGGLRGHGIRCRCAVCSQRRRTA